MIIGGLDVCDAFKFHRDEDTKFLEKSKSRQEWSRVVKSGHE